MQMIFVVISGILSILGGIFTISTFLLFPSLRARSQVFAIWLAICGIFSGLVPLCRQYYINKHAWCAFVGAVDNYFYLVALFTTVTIANCIRMIFLVDSTGSTTGRLDVKLRHYIFVWICPLCLTALPTVTNHYGRNENALSCWIITDSSSQMRNHIGYLWQGVTLYFPLLLAFIFNIYVYVSVTHLVKSWDASSTVSEKLQAIVNRIRWYPVVLFAVYIFPTMQR
jgi:hypothetical protein